MNEITRHSRYVPHPATLEITRTPSSYDHALYVASALAPNAPARCCTILSRVEGDEDRYLIIDGLTATTDDIYFGDTRWSAVLVVSAPGALVQRQKEGPTEGSPQVPTQGGYGVQSDPAMAALVSAAAEEAETTLSEEQQIKIDEEQREQERQADDATAQGIHDAAQQMRQAATEVTRGASLLRMRYGNLPVPDPIFSATEAVFAMDHAVGHLMVLARHLAARGDLGMAQDASQDIETQVLAMRGLLRYAQEEAERE